MITTLAARTDARHAGAEASAGIRWQDRAAARQACAARHAKMMRETIPDWLATFRATMPPELWLRFSEECRAALAPAAAPSSLSLELLADAAIEGAQSAEALARFQYDPTESNLARLIRQQEEEVATDLDVLRAARARRESCA